MSDVAGKIVTFYSYKGGTGRSMALANVAWILASSGLRVLAIDWDLEAPGLHRYFHPFLLDDRLLSSPGIIDWVVNFATAALTRGDKPDSPNRDAELSSSDWFHSYADLTKYAVSLAFEFPKPGTLDFISAGKQDPGYAIRVNSFNWKDLYEKLGGGVFLEAAKNVIRNEYDYILIDSRTGVSDTSGICTIQMPDELVVCFTLNSQSINGAAGAARSAREQRITPSGRNAIKLWPIPMRIETSEKERRDRAMANVCTKFNALLDHLTPEAQDDYWGKVQVPYLPFYAFEEVLATLADKPRQSNTLLSSMEAVTGYISGGNVSALKVLDEQKRRSAIPLFARRAAQEDLDDLLRLAKEYERIREKMTAGDERTYLMTALVERARVLLQGSDTGEYPDALFKMNRPGTRVLAISTALLSQRPSYSEIAIQAIAEPMSAFEQYHALVLANDLLPGMKHEQRARLIAAINSQRGKYLTPNDRSRWVLANSINDRIKSDPGLSREAGVTALTTATQKPTIEDTANLWVPTKSESVIDDIPEPALEARDTRHARTANKGTRTLLILGSTALLIVAMAVFYFFWLRIARRSDGSRSSVNSTTANGPGNTNSAGRAPNPPNSNVATDSSVTPQNAPLAPSGWGIIISADKTLEPTYPGGPSASWEVVRAWRVGYRNVSLFYHGTYYWTAIEEPDEASTEAVLKKIRTGYPQYSHWSEATKANLHSWCANASRTKVVQVGDVSANLYDCGGVTAK